MIHRSRRKRPTQDAEFTGKNKVDSGGQKEEAPIERLFRRVFGRGMTPDQRRILVGKPKKTQYGRKSTGDAVSPT